MALEITCIKLEFVFTIGRVHGTMTRQGGINRNNDGTLEIYNLKLGSDSCSSFLAILILGQGDGFLLRYNKGSITIRFSRLALASASNSAIVHILLLPLRILLFNPCFSRVAPQQPCHSKYQRHHQHPHQFRFCNKDMAHRQSYQYILPIYHILTLLGLHRKIISHL